MKNRQGLGKIGGVLLVAYVVALFGIVLSGESAGQRPPKGAGNKKAAPGEVPEGKKAANTKKEAAPQADPDKKNEPQPVDLETDDGVLIAATYFPSNLGKNASAVILLHGRGDKQRMFDDLAFALNDSGYAVLTLDFRGHGRSTARTGNPARTQVRPQHPRAAQASGRIELNDLNTPQAYASLIADVEAAKRFLVRRNNAGELNVSKLGLVGCEMGATIAVLWSFLDWNVPPQVGFGGKQGQDVQAVVLISPQYNFKGLAVTKELSLLQSRIPLQVIVGKKDPKAHGEASKMYESARKSRPGEVDNQLEELDTKLQGIKLLNPDLELGVDKAIVKFLDRTLKAKISKWEIREVSDDEPAGGQ